MPKKSRKEYARKKWCEEFNFFYTDKDSSWKYEAFKNKTTKEVTVQTIAFLLKVGEIVNRKYEPVEVFGTRNGKKYSRGTRMFRTYIYRAAVEHKIYDAHSRTNKEGKTPKTAGNWKVVDQAIDKWNKTMGIDGLMIENGKLEQAKVGRKELTQDDIFLAFKESIKKKKEQEQLFKDKK